MFYACYIVPWFPGRSSPKSAELWEGLGAAYQALGRHASALKSYGRALELEPQRAYCLMSAGALDYMNGAYISAAERYRGALQNVPQHPAALLGLAEVLLSSAGQHVAMGATGAAAVELAEAADLATAATSGVKTAAMGAAAALESQAGAAVSPRASAAAAAVALLTPSPGRAAVASPAAARRSVTGGGSSTAADDDTSQQQQQQQDQFQYSSNIATAWKLLGDVLMQQHLLQPAATAAARETSKDADSAVAAALDGLVARQGLLAKARRAYAHALMLNPTAGEVWGDVAQCYSHQARLLLELQPHQQQQQQGVSAAAPATTAVSKAAADPVAAARAAAVKMARGGLRLAPASSWLWGVLAGAAASAGDPAAAEYGYSRALALDPKAAMLWVQLGRLYSKYGSGEKQCGCHILMGGGLMLTAPHLLARGAENVWLGYAFSVTCASQLFDRASRKQH